MAFTIVRDFSKSNQKYKMQQHCIEFRLNALDAAVQEPEQWLKQGLRGIYEHIVGSLDAESKVGLTFTADGLDTDFHIPFKPVPSLKFDDLWKLLDSLYQSKKEAVEGDTFKIITTSFRPYRGSGRGRQPYMTFQEECAKKKGVITIKNKDNLCLVRALVVALAYVMNAPYIKQVRQNIGKRQDQEAMELMQKAGVDIPANGAGVEQIQQFQQHIKDCKITVYEYGSRGRDVLYEGPDAKYKLNLLHHRNHFNVITSLTSAFCSSYFCQRCHVPYNHKDEHRCLGQCPCCRQEPPCEKVVNEILCSDCNRKFRGQSCFDQHKALFSTQGKTLCERVRRCGDCLKTMKADRTHICGEIFCNICKKHQPSTHQCYIQVDTGKPKIDNTLFVFYDFENRPVLCVYQQRCSDCFDLGSEVPTCQKCGVRRQVITADDVIQPFLQQLFISSKNFKSVIVLAHNGQAYDHQFILRHALEQMTGLKPEVIMRGSKILMLLIARLKFIDSLNYFSLKLASLPKAFGLSELKKGYFPHLFNTLANRNYVGPLPHMTFYNPDAMKEADRTAFLKWYEENKHKEFDMQKEMVEYCISDVEILTQACLTFHKMVMEQGNVSPFTEAITIPGACNKLFRRNFLKPQTIGIIPKNGYRNRDKQSKIATQWLIHEEERRGVDIRHSVKQREAVVDGVKVDGYCEQTGEVVEFHGCYFHGCPKCFTTTNREDPLHEDPTDTLNARYERTVRKTERLRQRGYTVLEMWEHEFRQLLENDQVLEQRLNSHPLLTYLPLNPRDAFFGGRTGCVKSYYKVKPGEKIRYVDVCSLYPWVCKYGKFPMGHPTVHTTCSNIDKVNGLIKCTILPPQDLYHPVLPVKMHNKLMFALCRTCAKETNKGECCHSEEERAFTGTWVVDEEEERAFTGTWVVDEVRKALDKGYKLVEIQEVWEYNITQYDRALNTGGLFAEMMNKFIKIKQEASGWPSDCSTNETKETYVEAFLENEGVQLEFAAITNNPGLRSLAKLILNSFWGKFGQRENQTRMDIVRQPYEFYKLENNPAVNVKHVTIINDDVLLVSWEYKDEAADSTATVNVAIAAYVTAQARLKLYSYLEKLGDRVLYYDTDSVIYVSREDEWDIPTGSSLGEMTDELAAYGAGSYIIEFVSAGPKNYSFTVYSPTTGETQKVCKVKVFALNYKASQHINTGVMKQMVENSSAEPVVVHFDQIRRTQTHDLVTRSETKVYKPCLTKRKFNDDGSFDSTPFGFKRHRQSD